MANKTVVRNTAPNGKNVTEITHADSPYTPDARDEFISVDASGGDVTVNLPAAVGSGRVVDIFLESASGQVSIAPNGSDTINGSASALTETVQNSNYTLADYRSGKWMIR